jgi:hypothetical protein
LQRIIFPSPLNEGWENDFLRKGLGRVREGPFLKRSSRVSLVGLSIIPILEIEEVKKDDGK